MISFLAAQESAAMSVIAEKMVSGESLRITRVCVLGSISITRF